MYFDGGFIGPTFRQRLIGLARASTVVRVLVDGRIFTGRVTKVDIDNFEMVLTAASNPFPAGSIVNVSLRDLDAISVV